MKSWKVTSPDKLELITSASEVTGENQVKVKLNKSALCVSDFAICSGKLLSDLPRTIGQIGAGMVTEAGPNVTEFVRGDRVVTMPQQFCGDCSACRDGRFSQCGYLSQRGVSCDGFARDFAVLGTSDVYKLPERIKDSEAVFLDIVSLAISTINTLGISKGEHIVITDAGVTGLILGQVALYYQAVPVIIDSDDSYLEIANSLGIYYAINNVKSDPYKKIFNLTGGKMAETVALISDNPAVLPLAFNFAGVGGRIALINKFGLDISMMCNISPILKKGLTVHGIYRTNKNFSTAINMLANKAVKTECLIDSSVNFADVGKFIDENADKASQYLKYIISMQ